MASRASMAGSWAAGESRTVEIVVSRTESERWKTKLTMRSWVGDAVKSSWSRWERMRRVGVVYLCEERSGAGASAGVGGGGFDAAAASCAWVRRRGARSLADREGSPPLGDCTAVDIVKVVDVD
jgi:hypothetical protein